MRRSKIPQMLDLLSFNPKEKEILLRTVRLVLYFFVLLFLVVGLWGITKKYGKSAFSELGPIENCQLGILLITTLLFLKGAIKDKTHRPLLFFLSSLTLFAAIREQDHFFEKLIPLISWKFAWFFPLSALLYMFKKRNNFKKILLSFLSSNAFQLMFIAMIVFIPLAQCIGHRSFIVNAIGNSKNVTIVRRLIEETMELMAYILIFFAAIEMYWELFKTKKGKNES